MQDWLSAQMHCEKKYHSYVLVTVVSATGSGPRSVGSKMLVTNKELFGSIGGGHLEHKATKQARELLNKQFAFHSTHSETYTLGANLGQCCGGKVGLLFEYRAANHLPVVVFGAGHVGRALVPILAQMPVAVTWVDGRYGMLPKQLPDGVQGLQEENPVDVIADCPPNTCYLIMTHHHGLDLQLAEAALKRKDGGYVGVIGSKTKGTKFRHRLSARGLLPSDGQTLLACPFACPMGQAHIKGKLPIEVAVSVAAQVMALYQQEQTHSQITTQTIPTQVKTASPIVTEHVSTDDLHEITKTVE